MFTFQNIYNAYRKCRKNKTNTINVLKFEQNLLENLWQLTEDLQTRSYTVGKSICFLTHSPKLREVFAADFRDRIVHHLLIDAIEPFYEKRFIYDLYNNRKGKGIHQAKARVQKFMRREPNGYYLQLDIKGFFYHLDKDVYMNRFDHFVKRELKAKHYLRYVDDFVILEKDKEVLQRYKQSIEIYLKVYLSLSLREDSKIAKNSKGLDFLGYIIRPNYSLVRRRVVANYKQKKARYLERYENQKGKMNFEEIKAFLSVQASFVSHAKHANSFNLLNKVGKIDENNPFDFDRA